MPCGRGSQGVEEGLLVWVQAGRVGRCFGHPERLLDVPQVVVAADDVAGWHEVGGDIGDVVL